MKYDVSIEDVHGDWHGEGNGVPCEGHNPTEVFEKIAGWCRVHNVIPEHIMVRSLWKAEREEA